MKFKTCNCSKLDTICIITGFRFNYNGAERAGDLFLCPSHGAMVIHGVNSGQEPSRAENSVFTGLLVCQDEHYGESAAGGVLDLNAADVAYIAKYHNINNYLAEDTHGKS